MAIIQVFLNHFGILHREVKFKNEIERKSTNKRAHNKQVELQEESQRTPNINQHSASLHVD